MRVSRATEDAVTVDFRDGASGGLMATSDVPLDQLPDTFALDTELHIGEDHFVVVSAEPQTKREFARTRRLTVGLRRVEPVSPEDILFSLPSICGSALPEGPEAPVLGDVIVLHEDDWRQCELIACRHREDIAAELQAIREICATAAAAVGWRKIHVRERISRPLPSGLTWSSVAERLGPFEPLGGVAFGQRHNTVTGAVAARLPDDVVLWGIEDTGALRVLCIENPDSATGSTIAALQRVADELSLCLVHWCRCQVYSRGGFSDPAAAPLWG
jgi:hypothetical protein